MFRPRLSIAFVLSCLLGLLVLAGTAGPVLAQNAIDKAANRVSRDRWTRTEPASTKSSSSSSFISSSSSSDEDEDEEDEEEDEKPKREEKVNVKHDGELNGKVSIDAW